MAWTCHFSHTFLTYLNRQSLWVVGTESCANGLTLEGKASWWTFPGPFTFWLSLFYILAIKLPIGNLDQVGGKRIWFYFQFLKFMCNVGGTLGNGIRPQDCIAFQ